MSFIKLSKNFQEYSTLVLHPDMLYISSSAGITGSQYIAHVRSNTIKDIINYSTNGSNASPHDESTQGSPASITDGLVVSNNTVLGLDPDPEVRGYFDDVRESPVQLIQLKDINIKRHEPGKTSQYLITQNIKNTVRKKLSTYYKTKYSDLGWHYSNYHTLNFFKTDSTPNDSCFMYENSRYRVLQDFGLSFHINPRYDNISPGTEFDAGTIFHISSSIAVSLVSGSTVDQDGLVDSYKILVQLSQSADTNPKDITLSTIGTLGYPNDLIYLSEVEMQRNTWNHVAVRWGPNYNFGSGSIVINRRRTNFNIPSSSISGQPHSDTLILGNYFDGPLSFLEKYFNSGNETRQGIPAKAGAGANEPELQSVHLNNPLQAEIHNVMLFNKYLNDSEVVYLSTFGLNNRKVRGSDVENLGDFCNFYLGPYFLPFSPNRSDRIVKPQTTDGMLKVENDDSIAFQELGPFNKSLSFALGGRLINLENFVADISSPKNLNHPRLQSLTASVLPDTEAISMRAIDKYIFESSVSGQNKKRNLSILPNDNGLFSPDYFYVLSTNFATSSFYQQSVVSFTTSSEDINDGTTVIVKNEAAMRNIYDYSKISLENLVPYVKEYGLRAVEVPSSGEFYDPVTLAQNNGSLFMQIFGPYPGQPIATPQCKNNIYSIPAINKDVSSNEVAIFDIPQLFYGNAIKKNSFSIIDNSISGSDGRIQINLRDNGKGGLYRADALTHHARWNNVGDIIYEEGIVNIKSPHLIKYCKDRTSISFKGEQTLHTMILNIPVYKELFNSSSNKTYQSNPPTANLNDKHLQSKYVTAVNIHDNNFNIIMKAHFSQPILKTEEDEFVVRLKQDF